MDGITRGSNRQLLTRNSGIAVSRGTGLLLEPIDAQPADHETLVVDRLDAPFPVGRELSGSNLSGIAGVLPPIFSTPKSTVNSTPAFEAMVR